MKDTKKNTIGDFSGVGIDCNVGGSVTIGDHVMMGPECVLLSHNHRFDRLDMLCGECRWKQ